MKSQHRHELETNWLAQHTATFIERWRPYVPTIVGVLVAAAVLLFGYSFISTSTSQRESEAWNTYNQAVSGMIPNLPQLREAAAEYPDSPMQQWADITWADGQVWMASRAFIQNRRAAMEALNFAEGMYMSLLAESDDRRLANRAHYGLGRVFELRGDLDRAREEYLKVDGDFKPLAEHRAEELAKTKVKETYEWLATAEAPRRTAPAGPGTPGQRPEFSAGDLDLPGGTGATPGAEATMDDLFKGLGMPALPAQSEDRYGTGDQAAGTDDAADDATSDATDILSPQQPADEAGTEP